jgi:tRNA-dihydrouridine synthase
MSPPEIFSRLLRSQTPLLALAPMQDVTTLEFKHVMARYSNHKKSRRSWARCGMRWRFR